VQDLQRRQRFQPFDAGVGDLRIGELQRLQRIAAVEADKSGTLVIEATATDIDATLSGPIPEPAVRQFLMKNLTRDDRGFRWRIALDAIMQNYNALIQAVVVERPFSKPACFIRAGRSNFVADEDAALIRKAFPRATIETIARAGHWVHIDAANEFYQTVTGFLTAPDS